MIEVSKEEKKSKCLNEVLARSGGAPILRACHVQIIVRVYERENEFEIEVPDTESSEDKDNVIKFGKKLESHKKKKVMIKSADKSTKMDKYISNVGQVIAVGPRAYTGERF